MDLKRKIYLSPLGRIISILQNLFSFLSRPYMVYGYKRKTDGKFLKNTRISSSSTILNPENLNISDNVWVWHYSIIDASNGVSIGEGCQIGAWVGIFSHSSHVAIRLYSGDSYIKTPINKRLGYVREGVEIGPYTFIGAKATIMPGVKIGKGCLIAAGALVTKSLPDFSIAVGNPAVIKGDTRSLDKDFYLQHAFIKENYFDKEAMENYLKNLQPNS